MQKKLSVLALPACGGTSEPAASEVPASDVVELTLGSRRVDDVPAWEVIITEFNNTFPNITVKFDPTTTPGYNTTLPAQLETGTRPDLFFVRSFANGRELFDGGYYASLNDLPGMKDRSLHTIFQISRKS